MEMVALTTRAVHLTRGDGRGGTLVISHRDSQLRRGLEIDEELVLVDPDGEFHAATVVELHFELEDTLYVLRLGARLPPEHVRRLWERDGNPHSDQGADSEPDSESDTDSDSDSDSERELLAMLARLRDERGRDPDAGLGDGTSR
ncbi:hypothetical protein [Nocardioides acrostichi]|uniref:Uncharacterized protein n=1 Tax=Nocardioides acrostichi TaxID=2784339 RepID=A0A930V2T4_9ACTN|nr:hypothetical protein [Nocardioides acrostichi]MBF4163630.1 hypothetical protein [Nocardioides acrostichi]